MGTASGNPSVQFANSMPFFCALHYIIYSIKDNKKTEFLKFRLFVWYNKTPPLPKGGKKSQRDFRGGFGEGIGKM